MLETGNSEINVDQLMHEIRETVARQKPQRAGENVPASFSRFSLTGSSGSRALFDASPLKLQPEFQSRPDKQYHINDLLKYHGADFLRNAYRAILNREPDAAGWAHHLENLASGRFNKIDILASLRYSPEGERAQVKIAGLTWPAAVRRMGRAPVVGYLIQLLIALGRLPVLLQHQRQSEFYLLAQQQQLVDHDNQLHKQFAETVTQLSAQSSAGAERAANQQQLIELLSRQQQDAAAQSLEFRDTVEMRLADAREHVNQSTAALTQGIEAVTQQVSQTAAMLTRQAAESAAALTQQFEVQIQQLLQRQQRLTGQVEEQAGRLLQRQQQTQTELVMQERRLTALLEKAGEQPPNVFNQALVQQLIEEEDHLLDALYAAFEDHFRGEREEVKRRLAVYLPILKEAGISAGVLDIGCGRGEWLELLKNEGVQSRGVDRNRVFIDGCRRLDLDVTEDDALRYLHSLPGESLSAVTSFHLVEHLPFETLMKLLDESVRVLKSGGLLILETPDPQNFMVGSCNFYTDPTHRNPIPSPTLAFLLELRGLSHIEVMKLRPWDAARIEGDSEIIKRFNEYFYSAPDYGIIGRKV